MRTHAFVEGAPDLAFYRSYVERYVEGSELRMYNCEGKANVYQAYAKVVERFPRCRRVVFFVDKDLDDILGVPWPSDPRIYITDFYAVENYLVCKEVVRRFFLDFVKMKKVEFDLELALPEFESQLNAFHRAILPVMAWVVTMRRTGRHPILNDVNPGEFLVFLNSRVTRRNSVRIIPYLERVTKVECRPGEWRQVRQTCRELRRLEPKRYVRGKFDAWFLLGFIRKTEESLSAMARESGGAISVGVQLTDSNFIQLLVRASPVSPALSAFLEFHLRHEAATQSSVGTRGIWGRVRSWFRR
ncbi:MAG TPA: DUF4435 domain-containing protein [Terriglobales bacterium]|nr:DUF4435 domain-containing protein [Terriglobales bacterium]